MDYQFIVKLAQYGLSLGHDALSSDPAFRCHQVARGSIHQIEIEAANPRSNGGYPLRGMIRSRATDGSRSSAPFTARYYFFA